MRIKREKYPFTIIAEDKLSKSTGKIYQSIGVGFTHKAKDWTEQNRHYETDWFNFFDEDDLAALGNTATAVANDIAAEKQKEKEQKLQARKEAEGGTDPLEF